LETALRMIRDGAYDFVAKPFTLAAFDRSLTRALGEWRSRMRYRCYLKHLESLVAAMTEKLVRSSREMETIYDATVSALGATMDLRDPETEGHCRRVAANSVILGGALGLNLEQLRDLRWGAYLHDIGKIGIPEHILAKKSTLTEEEMAVVRRHPGLGHALIERIGFLAGARDVVLYHHEKYDGTGYPDGLAGDAIPMAARIFAVTDALDAMIFARPYRRAMPFSAAVAEIESQAGRHFDPGVARTFLSIPRHSWSGLDGPRPGL
jgi:HD-GYP domain-containing protein (c-di-GMP phosphodiesterase class II)